MRHPKLGLAAALGLAALLASVPAWSQTNWGAVVIGPGGAYGWAVNMATEWEAEQQALAGCEGYCTEGFTFYDTCGAIAVTGDYWYFGTGFTQGIAEDEALDACESDSGYACEIQVWACTD